MGVWLSLQDGGNDLTRFLTYFVAALQRVVPNIGERVLEMLQAAQMHLVIATRQDPDLPLARLRARGQLTELRAADLRFTHSEAAEFLNQAMGLKLTAANIAARSRTARTGR